MNEDRPPTLPRPPGGPGVTRFATRGGHRLSYESSGATDGSPILGLHDLLADRGQLRPLAAALPQDRFRLTLPDARGHGASPLISGRAYPVDELVADALTVLDAEGLGLVHIAAVGWGAATALGLAMAAPERITSLVLAQPFLPTLTGDTACLETLRQAADIAEKGQTDRALDLYLGMRVGTGWRDGLPQARLGSMRRAAGSLTPLLAGTTDALFAKAALESIDIPVTLLLPRDAPKLQSQMTDALAARVPRSRITTVQHESDALLTFDEDRAASLALVFMAKN